MSKQLRINMTAPDFTLLDTKDEEVRLSQFQGKRIVVLVLNRGFV